MIRTENEKKGSAVPLLAREKYSLASIIRKRVKPNTGFRRIPSWISQTWNTPSASSTPVYSQFTAPRWKSWHEFTVQFSILFSTVVSPPAASRCCPLHAPLFSPSYPRRNSLQQHSRPSPSIIYHFETSKMLLSAPVLEKFHPQSLQSRQRLVHEIRRRS